jgi:hypothetical protein
MLFQINRLAIVICMIYIEYRGNFKSHSKNSKDAIRKELQRVV